MALPSWTNSGPNQYDYAINGVPFLSAASSDAPYTRATAAFKKDQIDTTTEPGEQSLQGWWYRSQSSFDLGAGIKFMDSARDETLSRRFADSAGVDVFTAGQVTLLRKCSLASGILAPGQHMAVGFANAGEEGVLVSQGSAIHKVLTNGTVSNVLWNGAAAPYDLITDGGAYFASTDVAVYRGVLPSANGQSIYSFPSTTTRGKLAYAKERLIVAGDQHLWAVPTEPVLVGGTPNTLILTGTASATAHMKLYSHPSPTWKWTSIVDGPAAIYAAGYAGDYSAIYSIGIDTQSNSIVPTLNTPYLIAELPRGEYVTSMVTYMGTYVVIGTNFGVRVGAILADEGLAIGPLLFEGDTNIYSLYAAKNFVWASGSNTDGHTGLYRIDLSKSLEDNGLRFPYARDIYLDGNTWAAKPTRSIVQLGYTGRIAFTIDDVGLAVEAASTRVTSGWLETGKIRLDTAEDKIFQYIRVNTLPVDGGMKIEWRDTAAALHTLATYQTGVVAPATTGIRAYDTDGSDAEPTPWVSYRFTLTPPVADATKTPVLLSYQAKAQPANVKQRSIRVALMCFQREAGIGNKVIERSVWDRIKQLEIAEEKGSVVRFQDLGTGEDRYCLIDSVQFVAETIPETRSAQNNPGGILVVTLRSVTGTI